MCGLPLFPPKPKHEDPARSRRTFRRIAAWEMGKKRSNRTPKEVGSTVTAFAASSPYTPAERAGLFLRAGESHSDHD
jgi:hypothetical protein